MRTLILMLLLSATPSWAGPHHAEGQRLEAEMRNLATKQAWSGVERSYLQLEALEKRGVALSQQAHLLGAQAARSRGDLVSTWERIMAAHALGPTTETQGFLDDIGRNYGLVHLTISPGFPKEEITLVGTALGFQPELRKTVDAAQERLREQRDYYGPLPFSTYELNHLSFEVRPKGGRVDVNLSKPKKKESGG